MDLPVKHLSFSAIMEYCTCPQTFYKKYIRKEFDSKTWLGTVIGNGVHFCIDQFYKRDLTTMGSLAEEYILEKLHEYQTWKLVLNDKGLDEDPEKFERELRDGLGRCLPMAEDYIREKSLYDAVGSEVEYKLPIGPSVKLGASTLPLKAKIDLVTKTDRIYDWKVVKKLTVGEPVKYTLQAAAYALAHAEHTGKLVQAVTFVEFLRTPGPSEKAAKYRDDLALWDQANAIGVKTKKPRAPVVKEGTETRTHQEVVVLITPWKLQVFMELFHRIEATLLGENIVAQGRFLPALNANYDNTEGWEDFCLEVVGFNPNSGEVSKEQIESTRALLDTTKDYHVGSDGVVQVPEGFSYSALKITPLVEGENPPPAREPLTKNDLFF